MLFNSAGIEELSQIIKSMKINKLTIIKGIFLIILLN